MSIEMFRAMACEIETGFERELLNSHSGKKLSEIILEMQTEKNEKLISKVLEFHDLVFDFDKISNLEQLNLEYGQLKGFIDCAEKLFWITEEEYSKIERILFALYSGAKARINFIEKSLESEAKEEKGKIALLELLERNLNENGSGASAVKRFLLGLYNGSDYPFDLTKLRNLDERNFDAVLSVLDMNARSCPRREIHEYIVDGSKVWQRMAKDIKRIS
ncbi:hypothetical protein ABH307_00645 [Acinetobacter pittii]|uniref:DUF7673 family protein n=1 Tax=Acinetobacter pittii TaxID=48296 RepID=UPI0032605650